MASIVKCKKCETPNPKINTVCLNCGEKLYKQTPYKIAIMVTIILDIIFTLIYIFSVFLFIDATTNINIDKMFLTQGLPFPGSLSFYIIIAYFVFHILVKTLFILNHFVLKKNIFIKLRRIAMYTEVVSMFPLQAILALYFYNVATKKEA